MNCIKTSIVLSFFLSLLSCAGQNTPDTQLLGPLNRHTTYQFVILPNQEDYRVAGDKSALQIMRQSISKHLDEKGYRMLMEDAGPDLMVSCRIEGNADKLSAEEARFRRGVAGSKFPDSNPRGRSYSEAKLFVDAEDGKTGRMIWRGTLYGEVDDMVGDAKKIDDTVATLLSSFPPRKE